MYGFTLGFSATVESPVATVAVAHHWSYTDGARKVASHVPAHIIIYHMHVGVRCTYVTRCVRESAHAYTCPRPLHVARMDARFSTYTLTPKPPNS